MILWAKTLLATFWGQGSLVLPYESSGRPMLKNKMLAVIVIVVAAALGGGIMTFAIGLPGAPCAGITSTTRSFTIVEDVHGYAVDFYALRGTEIQGGQSLTVQFLASKAGQFRVYCNTLCSVHWSMLYG